MRVCVFQALQFNRQCEDLENWMDDVETQLSSEDHGKDITTVNVLLKKHQVCISKKFCKIDFVNICSC